MSSKEVSYVTVMFFISSAGTFPLETTAVMNPLSHLSLFICFGLLLGARMKRKSLSLETQTASRNLDLVEPYECFLSHAWGKSWQFLPHTKDRKRKAYYKLTCVGKRLGSHVAKAHLEHWRNCRQWKISELAVNHGDFIEMIFLKMGFSVNAYRRKQHGR